MKLDNRLSWILIPISLYIIWNKKYIKDFSYIFIYIALVGSIDTILVFLQEKSYLKSSIILLLHIILFYPLLNIEKYLTPNPSNYLLGLLGIIIIYFYPDWPYIASQTYFITILILVYIVLFIANYIHVSRK